MLEKHGLDWAVWQRLPANSYEAQIAKAGLDKLDRLYEVLFAPGITLEQMAQQAPPWPALTKHAGNQPTIGLLSEIRKRWRAEQVLANFDSVHRFVDSLREKLSALPSAATSPVTESILTALGQELIGRHLDGMAMSDQLAAVDRLLDKETLDQRERISQRETATRQAASAASVLKLLQDQRAREIAADGSLSNDEQIDKLGRLMFGEHFVRLQEAQTASPS